MVDGPGPIGIFDSGLGGLTVLQAAIAHLPRQDFLYLGDNHNAPYGLRDQDDIFRLTVSGVEALFQHGCQLVIIACNTAAAVALRPMQETWLPDAAPERRVLGVLVPMIEAVIGRPWAASGPPIQLDGLKIGFFATPATVASGAFPRELGFRARDVDVFAEACPNLVPAIEAGDVVRAEQAVDEHCAALLCRCPKPDAVILGCTHYPLVAGAFRKSLPVETQLLSQPEIVAQSLSDYLRRHPRFGGGSGKVTYLTTGRPRLVSGAATIFADKPVTFMAI